MGTEIGSWLPGAGLRGGLTCKPGDLGARGTVLYLDVMVVVTSVITFAETCRTVQ